MELKAAYALVTADLERRYDEARQQNARYADEYAIKKRNWPKSLRQAMKWEKHIRHTVEYVRAINSAMQQ